MSETNQNTKCYNVSKENLAFTLILKLRDESFDVKSLEGLTGLQESATTQNQAVFLTFDTKDNALEALKNLFVEQQRATILC